MAVAVGWAHGDSPPATPGLGAPIMPGEEPKKTEKRPKKKKAEKCKCTEKYLVGRLRAQRVTVFLCFVLEKKIRGKYTSSHAHFYASILLS